MYEEIDFILKYAEPVPRPVFLKVANSGEIVTLLLEVEIDGDFLT